MKHYPKTYEDLFRPSRIVQLDRAGSTIGTIDELAEQFRTFYHETHERLFSDMIKNIWLSQQFTYAGKRRKTRGNGHAQEGTFGRFLKQMVGISQKPITANIVYSAVASYSTELFPHFLENNPFTEPEKFAYPFKHVTLDQMQFVQMCDERMEMLRYSEEHELSFMDFANWATNHAFSQTDEKGRPKYTLTNKQYMLPRIRKIKHGV